MTRQVPKPDRLKKWALDVLERADPDEPSGSPGPGEVERAIDVLAWFDRTLWQT